MQYTRIVLNEPHASIEGLYDEHLSFGTLTISFMATGKRISEQSDSLIHASLLTRSVFGMILWRQKARESYINSLMVICE